MRWKRRTKASATGSQHASTLSEYVKYLDASKVLASGLPSIGLSSAVDEVSRGFCLSAEDPAEVGLTSCAEDATVWVEVGTTVADIEVPDPGRYAGVDGFVVSHALFPSVSRGNPNDFLTLTVGLTFS